MVGLIILIFIFVGYVKLQIGNYMLYSYKMTHDSGFAPNPFHGILSLATCKPEIRLRKQVGDYIAGFTSNALCGEKVGQERLIYIMKVTEKISYDIYWDDARFRKKRLSNDSDITRVGDNIYKPVKKSNEFDVFNYIQINNPYHNTKELMTKDLSGQYVLLSNDYFYFGSGAIPIDNFKIKIPKFQSAHGIMTNDQKEILRLWKYLSDNYAKITIINEPHQWPPDPLDSNCNGSNCQTKTSNRDKKC